MWGTSMPEDRSDATRFDAGMRVRRAVLGDEHVDRAMAAQTAFDAPFQRFITEVAWGSLWARDGLDARTRSLITVALLATRTWPTPWFDNHRTRHKLAYDPVPLHDAVSETVDWLRATREIG